MATPSYKWYQTSVLAWMWNNEAIRQSRWEVPGFDMFSTWNTNTSSTSDASLDKNREVEIGLWVKVWQPMSDMEKQNYLDSLSNEQYRQMKQYKDQWYSFEASRLLLENSDWLKNPTAMWTDKYQPKWNFFRNMTAWALDSVTWLPRMIGNWWWDLVWRVAKKLWADEEKVDYLVQDWKNYISSEQLAKEMWADKDSGTYKVTKWIWDITQTIAWEKLIWSALQGTSKWAQLLSKADQIRKGSLLGKMWVGALEWAADMWLYSAISESELPTWKDLAMWAAIWAAFPLAWAWLKAVWKTVKKEAWKLANKLELSWMLNPAKLTDVKNMLIDEWIDLAWAWLKGWTAEEVWTWMLERWMKWSKEEIITQLWSYSKNARNMKLKTLARSTTTHNVEAADWMLKTVDDIIDWVPWLEQKSARVKELMSKKWNYNLSELDEIKTLSDDVLDLFTKAWDVKAWASKKWLANLRNDLKTYIENAANKEWLWNIKMLNNEIQVSKALEKSISAKDSADVAREMLSIFNRWTIGWALFGSTWVWPFDSNTTEWRIGNMLVWALAGKYLYSTQAKTTMASWLHKLSWWAKKELSRLVGWEAVVLSKKTQNELLELFKDLEASPIEILGNWNFTEDEARSVANYIQQSLFE